MAITNTGIVERTITGVNDGSELFPDNTTSTATNTGIVERSLTGVNESELWLDSESTSSVINTGIVERSITGVNESDPMFPDNTISNIINLAGNLIAALIEAFKTRVSTDSGTLDNEVGLDVEDFDNTASLTMLPNAYKEGTLYSILPEDGTGDFDVVRGSSATRVNAEGLIEDIRYTTGNLIDYSTLSSASTSFSQDGDGKWVYDDSANGFLTMPNVAANVGDVFNVLVDVSVPFGDANFRILSGNAQTILFNYTDFPDGVTEFQATVTGADGLLQRLFFATSLNDGESTLNRVEITKVETATNIPRIDYTSGSPVLLVEPQSTNLFAISEDFNHSSWVHNSALTITSNDAVSPDGTQNADRANSLGGGNRLGVETPLVSGNDYTLSFYMKNNGGNASFTAAFNGQAASQSYTITDDWARYELTFTATITTTSQIRLIAGIDNVDVFVWGAQLEESSVATSYIPTSGTIATRLEDKVTGAGDANTFNSTEGVLYFEGSSLVNGGSNRIISLSDGTNNNLVQFRYDTTASRLTVFVRGGGGSYTIKSINGVNQTDNNKLAVSWNGDLNVYINGVLEANQTINSLPVGLSELNIAEPSGASEFEGKVKDLRVYNTALTDAELITLTTI